MYIYIYIYQTVTIQKKERLPHAQDIPSGSLVELVEVPVDLQNAERIQKTEREIDGEDREYREGVQLCFKLSIELSTLQNFCSESISPFRGNARNGWSASLASCEARKPPELPAATAVCFDCFNMFQCFRNASGFIKGKNLPSAASSSPGDLLEARMAKA